MPPRKTTRKAPEPVNEQPANGESGTDFAATVQKALDKENFSPTMNDYLDWFSDNVIAPEELADDLDRLMVMALQFYGPFQRSDFNAAQREARAKARATSAPKAPEEDEEPAKPARGRGRTSGKATATNKAPASTAKAGPTRSRRGTRATAGAATGSGSTPF